MDPYWIGMALLVVLCLAAPVGRRLAHARALRSLVIDGLTIIPGFWRLGRVRISRALWEAEVRFGLPGEFGGGQRGHLTWSARVRAPTPSLRFHAPGPEADAAAGDLLRVGDPHFEPLYVVKGDQSFGVRLMVQATRDLLVKLVGVGGRIWAIHEGTVEITGPFLMNSRELGEFLELSARILDRIAAAALPAEAPR
jgi:hypothetical protein